MHLNFVECVRKSFSFMEKFGFDEVEALPSLVRYKKGDIEVDVCHGRQSFEISVGVTAFGIRYSISEVFRHSNPEFAKDYRYKTATTQEGVATSLEELSELMQRYAHSVLVGDLQIFSKLESERKLWSKEYALDVLATQ